MAKKQPAPKQFRCINAAKCVDKCPHKVPHTPIHNGAFAYSYHTCENERMLMCGQDKDKHLLNGECETVEAEVSVQQAQADSAKVKRWPKK